MSEVVNASANIIEQPIVHSSRGLLPPILLQYCHTALRWRWLMTAIIANTLVIGFVYAVTAGGAAVRGVKASIQRIREVNGHVFGVALTKVGGNAKVYGYGRR